MSSKRDERLIVSTLGEYYDDILAVDAWINARSKANQANSLLCAKLQEREERIRDRIRYLASKRGMEEEKLWLEIIKGEATRLDIASI